MQMHIWHRACAKLNRTDCDRILRGDIEWMKDSKEALFQDFYLQATLNHLSPGNVIEYQKERLKCKEGYVAFVKKSDVWSCGWGNLFWPEAMTIQCLEENKVLTVYKKRVNLSQYDLGDDAGNGDPFRRYGICLLKKKNTAER